MYNVFEKIIDCISIPYAIFAVVAIISFLKSNKPILGLVVFSILFLYVWRLFFQIVSSRYCSIFIVVLFVIIAIAGRETNLFWKRTKIIITLLISYNLLKVTSSFRNIYIYDIQEEISSLSNNPQNIFFVEKKEFRRLSDNADKINPIDKFIYFNKGELKSVDIFKNKYEFWNYNGYIIGSEDCEVLLKDDLFYKQKKVLSMSKYITNKSKNKWCRVVKVDKTSPLVFENTLLNDDPYISSILNKGVLKSVNIELDTYLFLYQNRIVLFVGSELIPGTWIYIHVYKNGTTNEFDELGFHNNSNRLYKKIGNYSIYEQSIPVCYKNKYVKVGFYKSSASYLRHIKPFFLSDN